MSYGYDLKNNILHIDINQVPAYEIESNEIGICSTCGASLLSLSYHSFDDSLIVVAKCVGCNSFYANVYNTNWIWLDEVSVSNIIFEKDQGMSGGVTTLKKEGVDVDASLKLLNNIPMKQLQTIFSPAEINAMFARAKGDECVRQYLYNARKKYNSFEDVFGITIDV